MINTSPLTPAVSPRSKTMCNWSWWIYVWKSPISPRRNLPHQLPHPQPPDSPFERLPIIPDLTHCPTLDDIDSNEAPTVDGTLCVTQNFKNHHDNHSVNTTPAACPSKSHMTCRATWCAHPTYVPDSRMMQTPKQTVLLEHMHGGSLTNNRTIIGICNDTHTANHLTGSWMKMTQNTVIRPNCSWNYCSIHPINSHSKEWNPLTNVAKLHQRWYNHKMKLYQQTSNN